jgi:hypothetical protein
MLGCAILPRFGRINAVKAHPLAADQQGITVHHLNRAGGILQVGIGLGGTSQRN